MPSEHVYVRHLMPSTPGAPGGDVIRLADPAPFGMCHGSWLPSQILEPSWLRDNRARYDLVHVHFGFEHRTAQQLWDFVTTLRRLERPLVLTVHDLVLPHVADQRSYAAALDVLVPAAAAVITLTEGAAAQISRRWGRTAVVLRHPHVVDLDRLGTPRPPRMGCVVGLHSKQRANNDPAAVRHTLAVAVSRLDGARLHAEPERRLPDSELWDHLAALDVLVLPYRFGTHSGFVEACHDLGTIVLAPDVGFLSEQQPIITFDLDEPASLIAALRQASEHGPALRAHPTDRRAQRDHLAAAHRRVYDEALLRPEAA